MPREAERRLLDEGAVHHQEGLPRHDRLGSIADRVAGVAEIEAGEDPVDRGAHDRHIDRAPGRDVDVGLAERAFFAEDVATRVVLLHPPSHRQVEAPGELQQGVANRLDLKAAPVHPPEEPVLLVDGGVGRVVVARQPVRARQHDVAVELLERPAALDEAARQPVEKLGMGGFTADRAEVARRVDDAAAEVPVPDAVDDDSRGERVLGVGDPARQFEPPARIACDRWRRHEVVGDLEESAGLRFVGEVQVAAADVDRQIDDLRLVHGHGVRRRGRRCVFQSFDFGA